MSSQQSSSDDELEESPTTLSLFKQLPSDTVLIILDFFDGYPLSDNYIELNSISEIIKHCFGKFQIDSSIKFLFNYVQFNDHFYKMNLSEYIFICNEQLKHSNKILNPRCLLDMLCHCPLSVVGGSHVDPDQQTHRSLQKLDTLSKEHSQLCKRYVKQLNFYRMETFLPVIEKCLEVFPNFEELILGNEPLPKTKYVIPVSRRTYNVNVESFTQALSKSNKKCKSLKCYGSYLLRGNVAFELPNLEHFTVIGDCSLKHVENVGALKNLKSLILDYVNSRTYRTDSHMALPSFFKSLSQCEMLTRWKMTNDHIYGEEFIHLLNCLPNLTSLNLSSCYIGEGEMEIFEVIGSFHNLKILKLCAHTQDESLEKLVNLKKLEHLDIPSFMHAKGLRAITQLTGLKSLLADTLYVSDEEGKMVEKLTRLEQLRFACGREENFTIKLLEYFFSNLNVRTYSITYYYSDIEKLPQHLRDRMNSGGNLNIPDECP